jgi:DNA polymerase III subunit beta
MKTVVILEGKKQSVEGEAKPKEAMEILGMNPKEFKVVKRESTEKALTYTVERKALYIVPKAETEPASDETTAAAVETETQAEAPEAEVTEGEVDQLEAALALGFDSVEQMNEHQEWLEKQKEAEKLILVEPITGTQVHTQEAGPEKEPVKMVEAELSIERGEFTEALDLCCKIAGKGRLMPILATVRIAKAEGQDDGFITLGVTDLEVTFMGRVPGIGDPVVMCVPASLLLQEVKALPKEIETVDLSYKADGVSRELDINRRCTIFCEDPEEFPAVEMHFPKSEESELIDVKDLGKALKVVAPAMSKDQSRYILNGVGIDPARNKVVATDGFRLHTVDAKSESKHELFIVPSRAVQLLMQTGVSDRVMVENNGKRAIFFVGGGTIETRLIEGSYPDWQSVIPNPPLSALFAHDDLLKLIDGAVPVADNSVIRLTFNGTLQVTTDGLSGKYKWEIPCGTSGIEDPIILNFNAGYLRDILKSYPVEETEVRLQKEYGAVVFNKKAIIMPIRL